MGGITDEEKTWLVPDRAAAGLDGEQRQLVPVGQIFGVPGEMRLNLSDALPHGLHALRAQFLILSLRENETLSLAKTPAACESRRVTMLRGSVHAIHSKRGSDFGEAVCPGKVDMFSRR